MQGNEKQQTLDMQQEEIFRAAHALSDAEREIGDLRAQNAQIAAAAREAESQANADHNSEGAARRQLEGLRMEYLQVILSRSTCSYLILCFVNAHPIFFGLLVSPSWIILAMLILLVVAVHTSMEPHALVLMSTV